MKKLGCVLDDNDDASDEARGDGGSELHTTSTGKRGDTSIVGIVLSCVLFFIEIISDNYNMIFFYFSSMTKYCICGRCSC